MSRHVLPRLQPRDLIREIFELEAQSFCFDLMLADLPELVFQIVLDLGVAGHGNVEHLLQVSEGRC